MIKTFVFSHCKSYTYSSFDVRIILGDNMELNISIDDNLYTLDLKNNIMLFGINSNFKNNFINTLSNSLVKGGKNILIDGNAYIPTNYNIINITEENDFSNEFKFTKNNALKQLIYNDITTKLNEKKIIDYTNEIFDVIDSKVNSMLDKKINKKSDNNISFQIEIPDINSIIDKFTNIYIDDVLLSDSSISKSMKRKLLYQLYFLDIKKNIDKPTIVIINNFDAYLNSNEIIKLLNTIESLSNDNCHFILSSCSNIFEYVNLHKFSIYKLSNKLISLSCIDSAIKDFIIKREFSNSNSSYSFEEFYNKNEGLISEEEIHDIKKNVFTKLSHMLSKILNADDIKVLLQKPSSITCDYIICSNHDERSLFKEICDKFVDQSD